MKHKKLLLNLLTFFVIMQPVLDIYWLLEKPIISIAGIGISTLIRLLFIGILSVIFLFSFSDCKRKVLYITYGFLILIYFLIHHYCCIHLKTLSSSEVYSGINELFYVIRMSIPLVIIAIVSNLKITEKIFNRIIDCIIVLVSFVIVITNLFKISLGAYLTKVVHFNIIDWFNNIHNSYNFYYTATRAYFSFANMISSLLFGLSFILIYRLIKRFNVKNVLFLFIQMLAMFMLGTKVSTYGILIALVLMICIYVFLLFIKKERKINYLSVFIIILFILLWYLIFPYSPCKNRISSSTINENNAHISKKTIKKLNKEKKNIKKENPKQAYKFVIKNYKLLSIRKDYLFNKYPVEEDPVFWYHICNATAIERIDNRYVSEQLLDRMKSLDGRKRYDLFGIGYTRMSSTIYLERDFLSQYYTVGIVGILLFIIPYLVLIAISCVYMLYNFKKFNFKNISLVIATLIGLLSTYFCGNSLDSLTFNIIYAFLTGYMYYSITKKPDEELDGNKVTIVALHLGVGGVEKYISSLSKMLEKHYKVEIISSYKVLKKPIYNYGKAKITYLINDKPYKNEFINALKEKDIVRICKYGYKNVKILILKYFREETAISNIKSKYVITTIFHNKKVGNILDDRYIKIATEHNYHNNNEKYIKKVVNSVKNFNYLILVSEELRNFYKDKISKCQCVYIPNVIDSLPQITNKKENNYLISVGRLSEEKGYLDLIEVIHLIKKEIPKIKLSIIGGGNQKGELQQKIDKLDLTENISLLGEQDPEFINKEMQKANLYVMTSHTESFGIVLLEAMSNKLACIAFDSANGAKTNLKDCGILIENRNKEKMSKKIIECLENKNKLKEYETKGYNKVQKYLSSNVEKYWLELLNLGVNDEKKENTKENKR